MENKLGIIDIEELKKIEYKITNFKHKLINEFYSFNEETIFSLDYLEKLHIFLFNDLYDENNCKIRENVNIKTREKLNEKLKQMQFLTYEMDKEKLANLVYDIWKEQIFLDGNTRTLRSFLKIYCNGYGIKIDHDFDEDINEDYFIDRLTKEIIGKKEKYNI